MSRHADAVCANAERVRRLCIEEEGSAPERTFVVRNGLDLRRFDALAAGRCRECCDRAARSSPWLRTSGR